MFKKLLAILNVYSGGEEREWGEEEGMHTKAYSLHDNIVHSLILLRL